MNKIKSLSFSFYLLCLLHLAPFAGHAYSDNYSYSNNQSINLLDPLESYELNNDIYLFEDSSHQLNIEDVSTEDFARNFKPIKKNTLNRGYSESTFWIRFTLQNQSTKHTKWNLVFKVPDSLQVDLYTPINSSANNPNKKNGFSRAESGIGVDIKSRPVPVVPIAFPINIETGESKTYYIQYKHGYKSHINLWLQTPKLSRETYQKKVTLEHFFIGFVLSLLIFNLVLLVLLKNISYLYYIIFYVCYFGLRYGHWGLILNWVETDNNIWVHYLTAFFSAASVFFALQFSRSFLSTPLHIPKFDRFIRILLGLFLAELVLLLFLPIATLRPLHHVFAIIAYCLVPIAAFLCWQRGLKHAIYLLIAWFPFSIALLFFIGQWSGFSPFSWLPGGSALMLFATVEMICWSIALAGRVKSIRQEKQKAQLAEKEVREENEILQREITRLESEVATSEPVVFDHLSKSEFELLFRQTLVELMCLSLDYWEQSTRKTRFDLAEQSGIWRIYEDRGTLNTKTMDRYLSLKKIPQNPRWKDVLHTANFVLDNGIATKTLLPLKDSLESMLLQANHLAVSKRANA